MAIKNRLLTELLGITHPIILAPMGGVAGGKLAAAVTAAGGFGHHRRRLWQSESRLWRRSLDGAGVPRRRQCAGSASAISPGASPSFRSSSTRRWHGSLPRSSCPSAMRRYLRAQIKASGVKLICQVQDVDGARRALDAGADIIVAQGTEAGGHGKTARSTFALVPAVVDAVAPIPVVAAGGVADGRGLAAALDAGCLRRAGRHALLGDAKRRSVRAMPKRLLVSAKGDDTLRTRVFDIIRELDWPEGYSGRAIANDFSRQWHGHESALERPCLSSAIVLGGGQAGDTTNAVVFAGEGLDLIRDIKPAGEIVRRSPMRRSGV